MNLGVVSMASVKTLSALYSKKIIFLCAKASSSQSSNDYAIVSKTMNGNVNSLNESKTSPQSLSQHSSNDYAVQDGNKWVISPLKIKKTKKEALKVIQFWYCFILVFLKNLSAHCFKKKYVSFYKGIFIPVIE